MFNLEEAITNWRRQMAAGGVASAEALDELEDHLLEEIERQLRAGANTECAYDAAVALIGRAGTLKTEFAKVEASPARPGFLRACYFIFLGGVLLINTWTLLEYELTPVQRILGFSAVVAIWLYLACLPHWLKSLRDASYRRLAKVIKLASNFLWLWPIWALLEALDVVHTGMGIVPSTVLWCVYAAIAMTTVVYGLNEPYPRAGDSGGSPSGLPPPFQPQPIPPTRPPPPDFGISMPRTQMFAPVAREVLKAASEEASRLGHDFIGTEHVLLGLLRQAKGPLGHLLQRLHLDHEIVQIEIERSISAVPAHAGRATVPFTPRARKALQLAAREAKKLNQPCISAQHIFLGLLLEPRGLAGRVLKRLGIGIERTREEILSESGHPSC